MFPTVIDIGSSAVGFGGDTFVELDWKDLLRKANPMTSSSPLSFNATNKDFNVELSVSTTNADGRILLWRADGKSAMISGAENRICFFQ